MTFVPVCKNKPIIKFQETMTFIESGTLLHLTYNNHIFYYNRESKTINNEPFNTCSTETGGHIDAYMETQL